MVWCLANLRPAIHKKRKVGNVNTVLTRREILWPNDAWYMFRSLFLLLA